MFVAIDAIGNHAKPDHHTGSKTPFSRIEYLFIIVPSIHFFLTTKTIIMKFDVQNFIITALAAATGVFLAQWVGPMLRGSDSEE
tara:strand:- start:244 stop:495 length:252 start_codon:yes stop_codon:yes gene_type:complete